MTSSRLLIIFSTIIGLIVIGTVCLALFLNAKPVKLLPENTPEGSVQIYLLARQQKDYQKALSYLKFVYPPKYDWVALASNSPQQSWGATLIGTTREDYITTVQVKVDIYRTSGILESYIDSQLITFYVFQSPSKDRWFITSPSAPSFP
jgi:hypothetical protein